MNRCAFFVSVIYYSTYMEIIVRREIPESTAIIPNVCQLAEILFHRYGGLIFIWGEAAVRSGTPYSEPVKLTSEAIQGGIL